MTNSNAERAGRQVGWEPEAEEPDFPEPGLDLTAEKVVVLSKERGDPGITMV